MYVYIYIVYTYIHVSSYVHMYIYIHTYIYIYIYIMYTHIMTPIEILRDMCTCLSKYEIVGFFSIGCTCLELLLIC